MCKPTMVIYQYAETEEAAVDERLNNFVLCQGNVYQNAFSFQRLKPFWKPLSF